MNLGTFKVSGIKPDACAKQQIGVTFFLDAQAVLRAEAIDHSGHSGTLQVDSVLVPQ